MLLSRVRFPFAAILLAAAATFCAPAESPEGSTTPLSFAVQYDGSVRTGPLDGRVILLIASADDPEPRFQLRSEPARSAQGFGIDVEAWEPGTAAMIDGSTFGHPIEALADLPPGDYSVQAVLNVYETFDLATGHTVSLPPDRGEGQQWNRKPGNLYSTPKTVRVDPSQAGTIEIVLEQVIPEIEGPEDTKFVRHIRMRSDLLSEFWGQEMYIGAHVLVPEFEGPFDFVFVDADKDWYVRYLEMMLPKLEPGACFTAHNVTTRRGGWVREFLEALYATPGLETEIDESGNGLSVSYLEKGAD